MNQYIFDIPVYRTTNEKFDTEIDMLVAKRIEWIVSHDPQRRLLSRERQNRQPHTVIAESGGPWQFNQVVGWLRLYVDPSHVCGELWWVDAKRINRIMRKRRFYLTTASNVLATYFTPEYDSESIYQKTLVDIERLTSERPLKKRYLDLENFRNIGPFINWRVLLDKL